MKKYQHSKIFRNVGLPIAAAGVLFFAAPSLSQASDVSNDLLFKGQEGKHVKNVQELLVERDLLDEIHVSGTFTKETFNAIVTYQEKHGLVTDGVVGPQTLGAMTVLEKGDKGALVEDLQVELVELGFYQGNKDGLFGPLTQAAVKGFQSAQGIQVDGIAGPETYANLYYGANRAAAPAEEVAVAAEPAQEQAATAEETPAVQEPATEEPAEAPAKEVEAEPTPAPVVEETQEEPAAPATENQATFNMEATAYTAYCQGCSGITATGQDLRANPNKKVIAVDPNVIPLGSRVHVEGYGEAIAGDTGGAIKGHRVDLHMATKNEAIQFGRQTVKVTVLD
ncbi:peptidoglycan-binding protein [Bacillus sp. FJAT-45037]|uniref:peptidoglycan-binding protein n=1 Tax=Bacillus sp. FJAT-45037 TaxID=2011007 RepID=UPI000C24B2E8|nr:peptidoglycan-binding protein [Bacillus sp. FJAT-45037]